MIKPNMKLSNNTTVSYYSLVVAIAKRAREIAEEAELKGEILVEKPVDLAVNEYIEGAFKIVEPTECSGKQDFRMHGRNKCNGRKYVCRCRGVSIWSCNSIKSLIKRCVYGNGNCSKGCSRKYHIPI